MARILLAALVVGAALASACAPAHAQSGPVLRIEEDPDAPGSKRAISGWVYNDGRGVAGFVQLRLEVLDESNKVIAEQKGWAYGNVRPGGRAFFRIAIPTTGHARRIVIDSFIVQYAESP